jgi:F-type H+-transporting ATPase subunit delta
MAELATIARPYAEALFRVALPSGLNEWTDLLSRMAQVASVPELGEMASDPRVPRNVVSETFTAALKTPIGNEAKNFIAMLVENARLSLLPEIAHQFRELKNAHETTADAQIVSAFPMSDAQLSDLVTALQKKFGKKLNASVKLEPELIGGVRVVVGDEVLDFSVKNRLQNMQKTLAA